MAKNRSAKGRRAAQQIVCASNAINAGSKAFSPASLRGISPTAGKHKISLVQADGSKKRINYSNQKIKCSPDVKSGLRLSDLFADNTGRAGNSKISLRLMQASFGDNHCAICAKNRKNHPNDECRNFVHQLDLLVDAVRDCADLTVALDEKGKPLTIDNIKIYKPNASLQAVYDESKRADVRGIKFDNDASKVLISKRTKKGSTRVLRLRPMRDSIRFDRNCSEFIERVSTLSADSEANSWLDYYMREFNSAIQIFALESLD